MKQEASPTPTRLWVRRRFEANRMAAECQSRAYEQVLPTADRADSASHRPVDVAVERGKSGSPVVAKGVA
jgi:hypothetical protein